MSRKHPGMSDTYNSKRFIHKFMRGERARSEYFRKITGKAKGHNEISNEHP
jgi:hypothetical protein